ncbi:MAG: MATE family efflux transporter [Clostridiales bacterium]|nr:MATE family efflux transporter [Clostridiales bacterium]
MQKADRSALLGSMKMSRLVPKVSVPIMVSMTVQALYNIVDSIFVSQYNPYALTAVSLAMPFQMLMIALSTGMGTGINSLLSRRLGEKRAADARRASWNGLFIEAAGAMIFILLGLFLAGPLMGLVVSANLTNSIAIHEMGTSYLSIVTTWSLGLFLAIFFERILQATGNTVASMITQLAGAITNIILDPILIFGYLGFPAMGVSGAAVATVIGQWVSAVLGFILNQVKNPELRISLKDLKINLPDIRGIVSVGFPSSVMASIGSVMNLGMNAILSGFVDPANPLTSTAALNVLAVYFKLQSFIFMPVFGLASGIIAIIGYNFGAKLKERIYECIKTALIWAIAIMGVGTLVFMILPGQMMSIFESAEEAELTALMSSIGIAAMRIISINFIFAAVGIVLSTVFQAVGKGSYSLILSVCRQLVVLLPVAWLLIRLTGSIYAVWWCFPIAEIVSLFICLYFYRKCNRKMIAAL